MFLLKHYPLRRVKNTIHSHVMHRKALFVPLGVFVVIGIATHALLLFYTIRSSRTLRPPLPMTSNFDDDISLNNELKQAIERRLLINAALKPRLIAKNDILEHYQGRKSFDEQSDYVSLKGKGKHVDLNCNHCALVGNTGLLLQSSIGKFIDSSDCVFRLGWAPTKSYEDDVGTKTTGRIVDADSFISADKSILLLFNKTKHLFVFEPEPIGSVMEQAMEIMALKHPNVELYLFSQFGRRRAHSKLELEKKILRLNGELDIVSSIWYAFLVMEDVHCQKINIYGIPGPNYCRTRYHGFIPNHYWNLHSASICDLSNKNRRFDTPSLLEKQVLRAYVVPYNISFYEPSWDR